MRPMILLEINEVPWRIVDECLCTEENPSLREFFLRSQNFQTIAENDDELSPWSVWPDLHRGLPRHVHKIHHLGQDPRTFTGEPIWASMRKAGHSIGVFGSLQSWPPIDPGPGGFYVPDSFAYDNTCYPSKLTLLQEHLRTQMSTNKSSVMNSNSADLRIAQQILLDLELTEDILWKAIDHGDPVSATEIAWEAFKSVYDPNSPPILSTFFSNHFAAIMHRHWDIIFPQDFSQNTVPADTQNIQYVKHAIRVLERIINDCLSFAECNPNLIIVFATAMGQKAIDSNCNSRWELRVANLEHLLSRFGLHFEQYRPGLAMDPQSAVFIPDDNVRQQLIEDLNATSTVTGNPLFRVTEQGESLNIHIHYPELEDIKVGYFIGISSKITWEEAGIEAYCVKSGTAYHIPEGVLAIKDGNCIKSECRTDIALTDVKNLLTELIYSIPESREG